jgi:thioredoxin-like negative regulator of GroEL
MERLADEAFAGDRLDRTGTWAVAFVADWCPFCHEFLPRYAARSDPRTIQRALADLTDVENPLWERFSIEVVPTVVAFRDGRTIDRADGVLGAGLPNAELDRLFARLARPT